MGRTVIKLTEAEVAALGVSTDVPTAGRAFGYSRSTAYARAANDTFPCEVKRTGRTWWVPTAGLREALGLPA